MSKHPTPPIRAIRTFEGDAIAARLKTILAIMDLSDKRAHTGHSDMHDLNRLAREELHDVIAEVSE